MKTFLVVASSALSLLVSPYSFAGRDQFQILQAEKAVAEKRVRDAEQAKLQECWLKHGNLETQSTGKN